MMIASWCLVGYAKILNIQNRQTFLIWCVFNVLDKVNPDNFATFDKLECRSCYVVGTVWWIFSGRELAFTFAICYRRSVCLSVVCDVGAPYSGGWTFRQFFHHTIAQGLYFSGAKIVGGGRLFPLKFAFKVTHLLSNSEISTNIGS